MIRATTPDQQSLRSASKTLSSRMLCAASPSRSKGSKQSRPRLMTSLGAVCLQTRPKKSRFEAGCKCDSDELACAGAWIWLCETQIGYLLVEALRFDRCAAWHRARALRNTVWIRVSHPAASEWCSTETSGVSSKKAWLRSCNSERTARADFASMRSWSLVHEAQKADGRRGVRVQQLAWVVGFEGFYQAGHAFGCELGWQVLCPRCELIGLHAWRSGTGGRFGRL